jgi:beta-lactamase class A
MEASGGVQASLVEHNGKVDVGTIFAEAHCIGSLHARAVTGGKEFAFDADRPHVMASVVKVPIGLEFYAQVDRGILRAAEPMTLLPERRTPGPVGISQFADPVTMSLGDLAYLMLTISDNVAADSVTEAVGIDNVNARLMRIGCRNTQVVGTLQTMLDECANDLGHATYADLLAAQSGARGAAAQAQSTDPDRIDQCRALNPLAASRTTARDATRMLSAISEGTAATPSACERLRSVMGRQLTRRLAPAVPDGWALAAKSGGLFGRVRNEIALISDPGGEAYAVAVLTRALPPYGGSIKVDAAMVSAVAVALNEVRGS